TGPLVAVFVVAPVEERVLPVARALDPLQELLRDDLIGVDVGAVEHRDPGRHLRDRLHAGTGCPVSARTSTKCPWSAAAAAICGLTRCVRPPRPCRPSKLRFDVEAHRSPGASTSGFIPRHIEHPARRHSKPASRNIWSRPSSWAWRRTCAEPGTTSAVT